MEEDEQLSLESTTNEEQTGASAANNAIILSNASPLQAYIDGACNIVGFPLHVGEREATSPRQIICIEYISEMR